MHLQSELVRRGCANLGVWLGILIIAWSPFSGGARLPTLLLAMLGLACVGMHFSKLILQPSVRRWTTVFLLLWGPMWLSLWHAQDWQVTATAIAWFSLMYLAGLALLVALVESAHRQRLACWLSVVVMVWLLDSALQYGMGVDILGIPLTAEGRITGMFSDLHQGILMLAVLPVIFAYWQSMRPWLAWGLLVGVGVVVTLSGARGYLYIYGLLLLLGLWRLRPGWKVCLAVLCLPLLVTLASSLLNPQLAKVKLQHTQAISAVQQSTFDRLNHALSYRLNLWETGWHMWQAEPLTGIGSNQYKRAYAQYASRADDPFVKQPTHSHNIYVEWLAETGLVGGLGLVAIIVLCVRWFMQATPAAQQQAWPYAMPLLALYFPVNTTQPMLVPWWFPVLLLLICALLASLDAPSDDHVA